MIFIDIGLPLGVRVRVRSQRGVGPEGRSRARTVWEGPKGPTARPNGRAVCNLCEEGSLLRVVKIIAVLDILLTPFTLNICHPDFRVIQLFYLKGTALACFFDTLLI